MMDGGDLLGLESDLGFMFVMPVNPNTFLTHLV